MIAQPTAAVFSRPGIYFQEQTPSPDLELPPLDVAGFVGFAARGPLDIPILIEDIDAYRAAFGSEVAVARRLNDETAATAQSLDAVRYAGLPTAVADFFANGGRRCYLVRVAGSEAAAAHFQLPGLIVPGQSVAESRPTAYPARVAVRAVSPGRWGDNMRLATQLRSWPLSAAAFELTGADTLEWRSNGQDQELGDGELLQVTVDGEKGARLLLITRPEGKESSAAALATIDANQAAPLTIQRQWRLFPSPPAIDPALGLAGSPAEEELPVGTLSDLRRLTVQGDRPIATAAELIWCETGETRGFALYLPLAASPPDAEPLLEAGDVLAADLTLATSTAETLSLLLPVLAVDAAPQAAFGPGVVSPPPPAPGTEVVVRLGVLLERKPTGFGASPPPVLASVARLRFDLLLQEGDELSLILRDLGFFHQHARFWGDRLLVASSPLYQARPDDGPTVARAAAVYRALQQSVRSPKLEENGLDITAWSGRLAPVEEAERIEFYLPLGMAELLTEDSYRGSEPDGRGNDGLASFHAQCFVDRALVPDVSAQSSSSTALWQQASDRYYVRNMRLRGMHSLLPIDEVAMIALPDAIHVGWSPGSVPPPDEEEEAPEPAPRDETRFSACNASIAEPEQDSTDATATAPLPAMQPARPLPLLHDFVALERNGDFSSVYATLLDLHQAAVNLAQARRDLVALLSLPEHFERNRCLAWSSAFRVRLGLPARGDAYRGAGGLTDLSYAAVYHPWLYGNEPGGRVRTVAPDGAVCGMIAARSLARGAWIAPANVPLRNVLALQPAISDPEWAELFASGFNIIRAEPRDFRAMSAHTLSDEHEWQQLSVRRLMVLLRKVALSLGMDYVFENNGERLQNSVQLVLARLLQSMYARGAFAGATPQQSYRIVTDGRVNSAQARDNGRFVAEIQVAPSQPAEFIAVRLLRTVDGNVQVTEVR